MSANRSATDSPRRPGTPPTAWRRWPAGSSRRTGSIPPRSDPPPADAAGDDPYGDGELWHDADNPLIVVAPDRVRRLARAWRDYGDAVRAALAASFEWFPADGEF